MDRKLTMTSLRGKTTDLRIKNSTTYVARTTKAIAGGAAS
jgi:hypothetical protein